jgi:hypothetical protein
VWASAQGRIIEESLFERDATSEALVGRDIDCTHPALTDLFMHQVTILQQGFRSNHVSLLSKQWTTRVLFQVSANNKNASHQTFINILDA